MINDILEREHLVQDAWKRRDSCIPHELREVESAYIRHAFAHQRIQISRLRLRAEVFLFQN